MKANLPEGRQGRAWKSASDGQKRFVFESAPIVPDLVRLRAAQMSHCRLGIRNHMAVLREKGESEARIQQVENWCNSDLFNQKEKIALALAESVLYSNESITETVLKAAQDHFTREEIAYLVVVILAVSDVSGTVLSG